MGSTLWLHGSIVSWQAREGRHLHVTVDLDGSRTRLDRSNTQGHKTFCLTNGDEVHRI